jgi:hypothetical protein
MAELAPNMRGWRVYYVLQSFTRWIRMRPRAALWRQWKTPHRRRPALMALGVSTAREQYGSLWIQSLARLAGLPAVRFQATVTLLWRWFN